MSLNIVSGFNGITDPDALAYVSAVEAADGQLLEFAVGKAINDFVVGCKNDGIWNAIKASCILAGARTLGGALVPLAGTAPTNNGPFVAGDYNRKTGLVGNGSTKYLDSGRAGTQQLQDSRHLTVFVSSSETSGNATYIGMNDAPSTGGAFTFISANVPGALEFGCGSLVGDIAYAGNGAVTGLIGVSRAVATSYIYRYSSTTISKTSNSFAPSATTTIPVFAYRGASSLLSYTDARLAFYSIGEAIDLAKLDARVTALINAFGAAIP